MPASPAWKRCCRTGSPIPRSAAVRSPCRIDTRVQAVLESELANGVTTMQAAGGTGIVLDVDTGEVVAMASAPIFNPNDAGQAGQAAMMNRATIGVYELGSTFKPITVAAAMEAGVVRSMNQRYDVSAPIPVGRFRIRDDHSAAVRSTFPSCMVHSSNIATAQVADADGSGADAGRLPQPRLRRAGPDRDRARPRRSGRATGAGRR